MAQDSLEHAHGHAGHATTPPGTRRAATLVAIFAAIAVILEMSANDAQTTYLARTIAASDIWNEYQAKSVRRAVRAEAADMLRATGSGPAAEAAAARADAEVARLADDPAGGGMKQLVESAHGDERVRDAALHHHEQLERSVRVLQISIVLLGLYLATRFAALIWSGVAIGAAAVLYGIAAVLDLI